MAIIQGLSLEEAARRKRSFLAADTEALKYCVLSMAQVCGVSCWHANSGESAQMWEDFVVEKNGVAIRTTCGQLEHALAYAHNSPGRHAKTSFENRDRTGTGLRLGDSGALVDALGNSGPFNRAPDRHRKGLLSVSSMARRIVEYATCTRSELQMVKSSCAEV